MKWRIELKPDEFCGIVGGREVVAEECQASFSGALLLHNGNPARPIITFAPGTWLTVERVEEEGNG